jgi:hypothetical protein
MSWVKAVTQRLDEQLKVVVAFLLPTEKTLGLETNESVNRCTQQTVCLPNSLFIQSVTAKNIARRWQSPRRPLLADRRRRVVRPCRAHGLDGRRGTKGYDKRSWATAITPDASSKRWNH